MLRIISLLLGSLAMLLVMAVGYNSNVTIGTLMVRAILSFFVFYFIGMVVGIIVVKNTLEVMQKRKQREVVVQREEIKKQEEELRKTATAGQVQQ